MIVDTPQRITVEDAAVQDFAGSLSGRLIRPGDSEYDAARAVWNGQINRRPALIARCANAADVARTITFARRQRLPVCVRGGGHSTAGLAVRDGSLMIDLSQMKGISVDPENRTARAEPGLTLKELVAAIQPYGLATTTGIVSSTGIAGLTLGGGIGWLEGRFGLTCDNVLSFEVVTAEGQVRRASPSEEPDLYWALRGGGGNFGVVTTFEYRLHPLGQVLAGMVVHPMSRARELLSFYRELTANAPDELGAYAALLTTPDGHPAAAILVCYSGPLDEGERVLAPLRRFGPPLVDLIRPMDYLDVIQLIDAGNPAGHCYYEKGCSVRQLSDAAIEALAAAAEGMTSPLSAVLIQHMHGAASRVAPQATAFALRGEYYLPLFIAQWPGGDGSRHIAWSRTAWAAMQPFASGGTYINFMAADEGERVRAAYGANYERLVSLKNRYDPTNFFAHNQNICPSIAKGEGW